MSHSSTAGNPKYSVFVAISVTCKRCGGSGRVLVRQVGKPFNAAGEDFYATCPTCGGYGNTAETITDLPDAGERERM